MLSSALLLFASLMPQGTSNAPVVINEFIYDNSSTDRIEFVELYNRSGSPIDISGWVLDSEDPFGPNRSFTIPAGTVLLTAGRWTLGADAANPGNIDQVVGTTNIWENSNESLTLRDPNGRIVDTLVYEAIRGIWDSTLAEGPAGVQQQFYTQLLNAYSLQRCPDGNDNNDNGRDFSVAPYTPAAPNYPHRNIVWWSLFSGTTPGDEVGSFKGSFKTASVIDPTVIGPGTNPLNPSAIPASPTGGNCMVAWDSSGGGNANYFVTRCEADVLIRACVYIDSALTPAGEGETWNIGVRGTVGGFGHHTDPSGTFYGLVAGTWRPGNTGVAACWQRTETYNKLFLVDYGDGSSMNVLGDIDIVAGVNDGWRGFVLEVVADQASLEWGGSLIRGTVRDDGPGGIYIGYREHLIDNTTTRPPTIDDLYIAIGTNDNRSLGHGTGNSKSTPTIDISQPLELGGSSQIVSIGTLPGQAFLGIGIERSNPLLLPMSITPPGAELYIHMFDAVPIQSNEAIMNFTQAVPNRPGLLGVFVAYQYLQFDNALPYLVPITHSPGMVVRITQ